MAHQVSVASVSKHAEVNVSVENLLCVLIVDDDPIIRKIHTQLMDMIGFTVKSQVAENGQVAVDICTWVKSFDIILMDMEMPIKNGIEATKEIRQMGIESIIIGITSITTGSQLEAFKAAGINECFEKPLTVDKIKSILPKLSVN